LKTRSSLGEDKLVCALLASLLTFSLIVSLPSASGQPTGTVSGRVTNLKTGGGISNAAVACSGPSQRATTTNASGYYTISGLAPGPYTIAVSASGYVRKSYSLFVFASGTTLDFQLNMLSIRGRVYDASTAIGISEANVTIGDSFVLTNSSGHYEFLDLSDGAYTVTASAPGYASQSQVVSVSTGATTVANFGLNQVSLGTISGVVTDDSHPAQPINQATVRVHRGSFERSTNTDQNGQYTIANVPAWPYWTVDAYKVGYVAQSTTIGVQPGATTTLNFALTAFGIISGTVKDQVTNQPIAGALVRADSVFFNTTDSNGYYTMFVLDGTYTVTASAPGYGIQSRSVKVDSGQTKTENFLLQSVSPGSIIGSVTDATTGNAIVDATITADGYSSTTDEDGNYTLSNMPAWTYTVTVSASGFVGDSKVVNVPSGGSVRADFPLSPYTRVHLEPYSNSGNPTQSFDVNVDISDARFVYSWEIYLWWNPALLEATSVAEGDFLKGPFGDRPTQLSFETYSNDGVIYVKAWSTLTTPDGGVNGSGTLTTITFQIKARGTCNIDLTNAILLDPSGFPMFPSVMEDAIFQDSPTPVGGVALPIDKPSLLVPYIGLTSTIIAATAMTAICVNRGRRGKKNFAGSAQSG